MESNSSLVVLGRVVHGILAFCGCYIHVHLYASVVSMRRQVVADYNWPEFSFWFLETAVFDTLLWQTE